MYKKNKPTSSKIQRNKSYEGETIEKKIHRIINNKEPIKDGAPIIYTERKDGVRPEYDVRTDRFELAIEQLEAKAKWHTARREQRETEKDKVKKDAIEGMKKENGGTEPIEATSN